MHDTTIIPTILTDNPATYKSMIETFNAFTKRIQVDITDGDFTANRTIPLNNVWWPQGWQVDLHMMVSRPSEYLPTLLQLKPSLVIFHAEVSEDLTPTFQQLKTAGIKTGLALLKTTYPGDVQPYIRAADHVLVFAGTLGQQGGTADMMQIEKIPLIKAVKQNVEIGWDGGANLDNIRTLAHSGANVINVGSAISNAPDPAAAYRALVEEADKRGVKL